MNLADINYSTWESAADNSKIWRDTVRDGTSTAKAANKVQQTETRVRTKESTTSVYVSSHFATYAKETAASGGSTQPPKSLEIHWLAPTALLHRLTRLTEARLSTINKIISHCMNLIYRYHIAALNTKIDYPPRYFITKFSNT